MVGGNLNGVYNGIQTFLPRMVDSGGPGHIVNTASAAGLAIHPNSYSVGSSCLTYTTTKSAVVAFSEALDFDLRAANHPIGVTRLCPGLVSTKISSNSVALAGLSTEAREYADKGDSLLGRHGESPDQVGQSVVRVIRAGQLYLHTDRTINNAVARRNDKILSAMPRAETSWSPILGGWWVQNIRPILPVGCQIRVNDQGRWGLMSTRRRRSDAEVVAAVRTAVIEELVHVGMGKLTMDGIAQRAAIAKTSLYRRWRDPQAVVLDALRADFPQEHPAPAPTNNLRNDLIEALRLMVSWLRTPTARVIGTIIAERARYPELAEAIYSQVFEAKGGRFTGTVLRHYAEAGQIDPTRLTSVVLDIGEALVLKAAFDSDRLPTGRLLIDIVDQAILPAVGVFE
ncbi:SDR family NAD(P)-dependent oxidoreductase [Nocardia flavorosea]|uniref:SDR family NAD(P)-dependent oxidoreductase n=1 Tax=Nocardia flavorosea TaxID=53429 RepID=A0A846YU84_9NOCA|nr:SDR family NAD(P)-dependent oxidoreductase [Nocardia flavorosea]